MKHPHRDVLRSYVDGTMDTGRRWLVAAHLARCHTCPGLVADSLSGGEPLPDAALRDEIELPSFDRLWTEVERLTVRRRLPAAAVLPAALLASLPEPSAWQWIDLSPGIRVTSLHCDFETGSNLFLTHFGPGSAFPRHRHVGLEENVILAGGYASEGTRSDAGDWIVGAPGTEEMPTTEPREECWCLSRIEPPGVKFFVVGT